jgi:tRNA(Ile)-lysidine synthase
MIEQIKTLLVKRRLIAAGDRVTAAVSGGADSVAMLIVLSELRAKLGFELTTCHLNHQLRGEASDGDEEYVRRLCERLNVPVYVERQNVNAIQQKQGGSLEEVARRVRYDFFERAANEFHANKIALGHHRDDQCETVIFNLLRGSNVHGLRGIPLSRSLSPDSNVKIVRPMLSISKADLENFLRARKIDWREDHTNFELQASRNVIRHKVLPAMAEANESVREHLLLLAEQAGEIESLLSERAEAILRAGKQVGGTIRIETWRLKTLPKIVASEVARLMLIRLGVGLRKFTADHFRRLAELSEGRLDLPGGLRARVEYGWLILGRFDIERVTDHIEKLPIGGSCRFRRFEFSAEVREFDQKAFKCFLREKIRQEEWLDADKISGPLSVRYAKEGERFHPLGAPGSKKVGDFLTDVKAGFAARPAVVVADENGIVWLVNWRVAERARISEKTEKILRLFTDKM